MQFNLHSSNCCLYNKHSCSKRAIYCNILSVSPLHLYNSSYSTHDKVANKLSLPLVGNNELPLPHPPIAPARAETSTKVAPAKGCADVLTATVSLGRNAFCEPGTSPPTEPPTDGLNTSLTPRLYGMSTDDAPSLASTVESRPKTPPTLATGLTLKPKLPKFTDPNAGPVPHRPTPTDA